MTRKHDEDKFVSVKSASEESKLVNMLKKGSSGWSMIRNAMFWLQMLLFVKQTNAHSPTLCLGNTSRFHFQSSQNNLYQLSIVSPQTEYLNFFAEQNIVAFASYADIDRVQKELGRELSKRIKLKCNWKKSKSKNDVLYGQQFVSIPYNDDVLVYCNMLEIVGGNGAKYEEIEETRNCLKAALTGTESLNRPLWNSAIPSMPPSSSEKMQQIIDKKKNRSLIISIISFTLTAVMGAAGFYVYWYRPYQRRKMLPASVPENNRNLERIQAIGTADEDIPSHYCCSITFTIMTDPVIVSSGSVYERHNITEWMRTKLLAGHPLIDPCKSYLTITKNLTPADELRSAIELFVTEQERRFQERHTDVIENDSSYQLMNRPGLM